MRKSYIGHKDNIYSNIICVNLNRHFKHALKSYMNSVIYPFILCIPLLISFSGFGQHPGVIPGELIVMVENDTQLKKVLRTPVGYEQGQAIYPKMGREISAEQGIYLLTYNSNIVPAFQAKKILSKLTLLTQHNHRVSIRNSEDIIPNDDLFSSQWALNNTGQEDGIEDADVDVTEVWDLIPNNQVTSLGDSLVLAIVDQGFEMDHEDLNFWKNRSEIPNNNIDDDKNGYVDDFDGWNAFDNNGIIPSQSHGTHVAGIAGAIGNNGTGIAGISWGVPLLAVAGSTTDEATVVSAYSYVLNMRKRFNESNGASGAFIIATNSSFGVDRGMPEDFPIWCAMYDSLGEAGILSVGATVNTEVNVEIQGDIPTRCVSDHFIGITRTNRFDELPSGSGFGEVSIDLGAPGDNIISSIINNAYGFNTGASMAAPHVTGAISLLYAAACPELIAQYKNNPAEVALLMKEFILNGVDTLSSLSGKTVTGGRLNIKRSLDLLNAYCEGLAPCVPPFDLTVNELIDTTASLSWEFINSSSFIARYKRTTDSTWTTSMINTNDLPIQNLSPCEFYEFQVASICSADTSAFSPSYLFQTDGCCSPPKTINLISATENSLLVNWDEVLAAQAYELMFREKGSTEWNTVSIADTFFLASDVATCQDIEFQIATLCDTGLSVLSAISTFSTIGCGFCLDTEYCASKGLNTENEWIDSVLIGDFVNGSGADGGFGDYTDLSISFKAGLTYPISFIPGFPSNSFPEYWKLWIDLNKDGSFQDPEELLFDSGGFFRQAVSGEITIPTNVEEGLTRMRVSMKFDSEPVPCESFRFGEVEDYCVTIIQDSTLCLAPSNPKVVTKGENFIDWQWDPTFNAVSYTVDVRSLDTLNNRNSNNFTLTSDVPGISVENLQPCTNYEFVFNTVCEDSISISVIDTTRTLGCGTCQDSVYCVSGGNNVSDEWIERISVNGTPLTSGENDGYGDFTTVPLFIQPEKPIVLNLVPGFKDVNFEEYWRVYIDLNQDGSFSEIDELVYDPGTTSNDPVDAIIELPDTIPILEGPTRMRIVMQYRNAPNACGVFEAGEVEDYCITFQNTVSNQPILQDSEINIFPNPFLDIVNVNSSVAIDKLFIQNLMGQTVYILDGNKRQQMEIDLSSITSGVYFMTIQTVKGDSSRKIIKSSN